MGFLTGFSKVGFAENYGLNLIMEYRIVTKTIRLVCSGALTYGVIDFERSLLTNSKNSVKYFSSKIIHCSLTTY